MPSFRHARPATADELAQRARAQSHTDILRLDGILREVAGAVWPDTPEQDDPEAILEDIAATLRRAGYGGSLVLSSLCRTCWQASTHAPGCIHDTNAARTPHAAPERPAAAFPPGDVAWDATEATCPVCDRVAPPDTHPCRFATACVCWYGVPCQLDGDPRDLA